MESSLLAFPVSAAKLELVSDASGDFMGGVLDQIRNGNREPLAQWTSFTRNQYIRQTAQKMKLLAVLLLK